MQIDKMTKAKVTLVTDHPFFGALALRYPAEDATEAGWCHTMATDGRLIYFNRDFVEKIDRDEVVGVVAHEVCHIAFMHHIRRGERHSKLWNIATDYAINWILKESNFKLPEGGCIDAKYQSMTAEKIYDLLIDDIKSGKIKVVFCEGGEPIPELDGMDIPDGSNGQAGNGKGTVKEQPWGQVKDMPGSSDAGVRAAEEAELKVRVLQAANTAKSKGRLPSAFEGLIEKYKSSKVNWKERLRTFVGGNNPDDWSYRRPNRKYMALSQVYLPTVECHGAGVVVVAVDSSGSVSNEELAQFLGEIRAIHNEMRPEATHVVWCDTEIQHTQTYTSMEEFDDQKRYGCGGTVLNPAFKWVADQGIIPDSFIFFTDLEIYEEEAKAAKPDYPVLWISTGRETAPFGEVVKISYE